MNLLFACYGNICRSPMAEGLAKKLLGPEARVESAGLAAMAGRASEESIVAMKALFAVDISGHRPRSVSDVDLDGFDFIIAIDTSIYSSLKAMGRIPKEKLRGWDIADPLGQGLAAYLEAARKIQERLRQFLHSQGIK
jgi:protein-tyrosine-phosphatase